MGKTIGIILIALGLVALVAGGFSYTTKEKIVDIGPLHATKDETHSFPLTPAGIVLVLVGGVVLLISGRKVPV
jgi:hypothetical protein